MPAGTLFDRRHARDHACWLNHPQGCLGFRIETPVGTIVYATDNEPGNPEYDRNLRRLAEGADIFINDAQYTPEQMEHASRLGPFQLARRRAHGGELPACGNLVLFHHDPDSSDKTVDGILRDARAQFENTWAAAEGMVMTLGEDQTDVVIPAGREGLRREAHFRARVTGLHARRKSFRGGDRDSRSEPARRDDLPGSQSQIAIGTAGA